MKAFPHHVKLLSATMDATLTEVDNYLHQPADLRIISLSKAEPEKVLIYFEQLVDEDTLFNLINLDKPPAEEQTSLIKALAQLSSGHAVLLEKVEQEYRIFLFSAQGWQLRPIQDPISEQLTRGPREGFTETITVNTAMIRRWINDPRLCIDELKVGVRTQTKVRLLYLVDVANPEVIKEVRKRIAAIKIDGIIESGYIEQLITDNRLTIFPQLQSTERSDKVAAAVLNGRIGILVDKSPFALIVPVTINELYQSPDDYYYNYYLGSFLRLLRLLGNNLAVALPGLYVALATSEPELLPTNFAYSIAQSRQGIPYPLFIEVLLLEIMVEIFREAGLRLPRNVNQTLGIASGFALAFAAVQTHLVSGTSLVIVMIAAIASFSTPSYAVGIPWRIFKFILLIVAATMGIVGISVVGLAILAHAATLVSFGSSYLAPWAPIHGSELKDSVFRFPLWLMRKRSKTFQVKNEIKIESDTGEGEPRQ